MTHLEIDNRIKIASTLLLMTMNDEDMYAIEFQVMTMKCLRCEICHRDADNEHEDYASIHELEGLLAKNHSRPWR